MAAKSSTIPIYSFHEWEIDLFQRELRLKGTKIPIGNRAFEVLEVLVKAQGATIDKYELMRQLWPGAIVEENTLQFHVSALRKAFQQDRNLVKTAFGKGYRLLGRWVSSEPSEDANERPISSSGQAQSRYSTNLPASISELIGRGAALGKLHRLLTASRIVTLCGPGGIGKTTLCLEAAREFSLDFEGDTALVELSSVSDPNLVASAVATSLELRLGGYQITPLSIAQAIETRRILLVIDNCEHLVDAVAELAETLLRLCRGISILATSREPLRIAGEKVFQVPPLDVPAPDGRTVDVLDHSAIKLFIARSGEHLPSSLPDESLSTIAVICRRLDGIPLAIEFAAARSETLGVTRVAERLNDRFTLLAGTRRTVLPRHQTLRATLDWSYELLQESEQYLLRHLSIFPGGFTIDAARAMSRGSDGASLDECISSLVWKSLITLVPSSDGPRWRLLETTRAYGLEKLVEKHERTEAARRQAEFLCRLLAPSEGFPFVSLRTLPRFVPELDNVRASLDWAFSEGGDLSTGIRLAAAYAPVWLHLALVTECRDRLAQAQRNLAAASGLSPRLASQLLTILGLAENYTGVADETTRSRLMSALEIAEQCGDPESELQALYASWSHDFIRGRIGNSITFAERISEVGRRRHDPGDERLSQRLLGSSHNYSGDQAQALSCFESALVAEFDSEVDRAAFWFHLGGQSFPRARLARTLWLRGHAQRGLLSARATFEEAQARNHKFSMCLALTEAVCPVQLMAGNLQEASQSIAMLTDLAEGSIFGGFARYLRGSLLVKSGDHEEGVKLLRAAHDQSGSVNGNEARTSIIIDFATPQGSGFLLDFVDGLIGLGKLAEAEEVLEREIAQARLQGLLWHMPELLRLKAELLGRRNDPATDKEAARIFLEAIEISKRQGSLYWQLRAATSLLRLQSKCDNGADARALLEAACRGYANEPPFLDLQTAYGLLGHSPGLPPG